MDRLLCLIGLVLVCGGSAVAQFEQRALEAWRSADTSGFGQGQPGEGLDFEEATRVAESGGAESLLIAVDGRLVYERVGSKNSA